MKTSVQYLNLLVGTFCLFSLSSCIFHDDCKDYEKEWKEDYEAEQKLKTETLPMDVFIENSGSINGYVGGMGYFKTDTYALISSSVVPNPSLNYINSQVLNQTASGRDFILNLTPEQFQKAGGNLASTDIAAVIELASKKSFKTTAMLVSDFIFSPDKAHRQNVEGYFNIQKNDIKNTIAKLLNQNKNLAVVVFKGSSQFNGIYYNKYDAPIKINCDRPYYTMLIGPKQQVALLINKTKGSTHFQHAYSEFTPSVVNYEILSDKASKVGNFRPCKKSKHHVKKIQTERRGSDFKFKLAVDFSNLPLNDLYLSDCKNYELSDSGYKIESIQSNPDGKDGFTHIITIASTERKPRPAELDIVLCKHFPDWIQKSQDSIGDSAVSGKTFGIQPLLEGIKMSYDELKGENDYYTKMKVFLED